MAALVYQTSPWRALSNPTRAITAWSGAGNQTMMRIAVSGSKGCRQPPQRMASGLAHPFEGRALLGRRTGQVLQFGQQGEGPGQGGPASLLDLVQPETELPGPVDQHPASMPSEDYSFKGIIRSGWSRQAARRCSAPIRRTGA
jgi:hypothetical protein